ncbi:MAG: DUF1861 family protein [Opitutaceae bacterium]|jgi:hypothetical protein|nr:DUF1861 family protein [Opitutaceae bacterium]
MTNGTLSQTPATCARLRERLLRGTARNGKLRFAGTDGKDVYNITAPFAANGRLLLAGRVEERSVERSSVLFFEENNGVWRRAAGTPVFEGLQDPCVAFINGEWVFGGVNFPVMSAGQPGWRMEFFRGKTPDTLRHFLSGPDRMKDIRLAQLTDGRVGVFTRPQGTVGGRGKIGFLAADSLERITAPALVSAPLLAPQCVDDEWVGANEIHPLPGGVLGVLGHIAHFSADGARHYCAMAFRFDPATRAAEPLRLIADRGFFPPGPAKRPDLADVIFSGGLSRDGNGSALLYAGLGDCEAGWTEIPDPFAA